MQYLFESAICLACFYAFYWLALRRETFFQWNRWYLLTTPLLSFAIPALTIQLAQPGPANRVEAPVFDLPAVVEQTQTAPLFLQRNLETALPVGEREIWTIGDLFSGLYLAGVAFLTIFLLTRLLNLFRLIRRCRKERRGGITIAESPDAATPAASFFSFVFWNKRELTENERLIIEHELVHARQWHSIDVLLAEALIIWQWFNPLVYVYRRSLQAVHEYIADDFVVRRTKERYAYASLLAQQYRDRARPDLLNTFHAQLKNRLIMLAKHPSHRFRRAKFALAFPLALGLMLLFSFRLIEKTALGASITHAIQEASNFTDKIKEVAIVAHAALRATAAEETPYIFYWGAIQCRFLHNEGDKRYFAEVHISPDVFRESLKREPRLWNGQSLEQKLSFQLHNLNISSDYYDETKYSACRKLVEEYVVSLQESDYAKITRIGLPGGQFGQIEVFLDAASPGWLPKNTSINNWRTNPAREIHPEPKPRMEWGKDHLHTSGRQFFSISEFWKMVEQDAVIRRANEDILIPENIYTYMLKDGKYVDARLPANEDGARTWPETRERLHELKDLIVPGTTVYFDWLADRLQTDTFTYFAEPLARSKTYFPHISVALFDLVPDNDPRLALRNEDLHGYNFEWGNYSGKLYSMYAKTYLRINGQLDTVIYSDRADYLENRMFTAGEIVQMLELPARFYREKEQMNDFAFTLQYKDRTVEIRDGVCPADLISYMRTRLKPQDTIKLSGFKAAGFDVDLPRVYINLEVKANNPKPPLRPTYAPATAIPANQVRIYPPVPNPAQDQAQLRFYLPKAGKADFLIIDAAGKVVWRLAGSYSAGDNSVLVRTSELGAKGWFTVSLETPFGTVQEQLVVAE